MERRPFWTAAAAGAVGNIVDIVFDAKEEDNEGGDGEEAASRTASGDDGARFNATTRPLAGFIGGTRPSDGWEAMMV